MTLKFGQDPLKSGSSWNRVVDREGNRALKQLGGAALVLGGVALFQSSHVASGHRSPRPGRGVAGVWAGLAGDCIGEYGAGWLVPYDGCEWGQAILLEHVVAVTGGRGTDQNQPDGVQYPYSLRQVRANRRHRRLRASARSRASAIGRHGRRKGIASEFNEVAATRDGWLPLQRLACPRFPA